MAKRLTQAERKQVGRALGQSQAKAKKSGLVFKRKTASKSKKLAEKTTILNRGRKSEGITPRATVRASSIPKEKLSLSGAPKRDPFGRQRRPDPTKITRRGGRQPKKR